MPGTSQVEEFLPYMPNAAKCERVLQELNFAWRLMESTAKMICPLEAKTILPTLNATRDGFMALEVQLINNLVQESVTKSVQEINFKAQVIIDIVVRNLFERTADVGFLAMDEAIRAFILNGGTDADRIVRRLQEYRNKYTVYDEILILDTQGKVLAHLDADSGVAYSHDPLIAQTLSCDTYVETFRNSDLRPGQERSLIYSRKIAHPQTGDPIGVLCLCFPLAVEMEGVFAHLGREHDRSIMLMLDHKGYVIASSDANHIPPGRQVPKAFDGDYEIVSYCGREYLAKTCSAQNYQGYSGPGWLGHVMVPCETAFRRQNLDTLSAYDAAMVAGVMAHAKSFCPPLYDVVLKADAINVALRRVVWNGQIMSSRQSGDLARLKSILQEVSRTGDETNRVFKNSIGDLYTTVISSGLQDVQFISRLMVDIMDRNLYERANDCRWWALTPDIRRLMANRKRATADLERMTEILEAINALYTAYTRLVVFDTDGVIVAASNLHGDEIEAVGNMMDQNLVQKTLALRGSQDYCVSPFEPTWLYGDRPTYIYCAAIYHPEHPTQAVGGIGIVFDSEQEFKSILLSSLPKRAGTFAAFTDRAGNVISSTHPNYPPGSRLRPEESMLKEANGISAAKIIVHKDEYAMVGYTASFGYREFKNSDDYQNDVISMVFVPIGAQAKIVRDGQVTGRLADHERKKQGAATCEFATFFLDDALLALPTHCVIEAVEASGMNPASTLPPPIAGLLNHENSDSASSAVIPVVDMRCLLYSSLECSTASSDIIIVRHGPHTLGLLVDRVHDVLEFDEQRIEPAFKLFYDRPSYVCNFIKTGDQDCMIQVIDCESIVKTIF